MINKRTSFSSPLIFIFLVFSNTSISETNSNENTVACDDDGRSAETCNFSSGASAIYIPIIDIPSDRDDQIFLGNFNGTHTSTYFQIGTSSSASTYGVAVGGYNNVGAYSVGIGFYALYSNNYGSNNTASGNGALYSNTTGYYNTAIGVQALYNNTTASQNTAVGRQALRQNTTGALNTAVGSQALYNNDSGSYNTASGNEALYYNNYGNNNTASGNQALYSNYSGNYNTASGNQALYYNLQW